MDRKELLAAVKRLEDPRVSLQERLRIVAELPPEMAELVRPHLEGLGMKINEPLQTFEPHSAPQEEFFEAKTRIVAAFAGNQFGKTTALVVRTLIECVDREWLPQHLQRYKRWDKQTAPRGTHVRLVCPSFKVLGGNLLPALRAWCPSSQLVGDSFDKAFRGAPEYTLRFKNGSIVEFMTYDQEVAKFGGPQRHIIGYDEPPPQDIRRECAIRTVAYSGYEMFAMTPLKANTGWIRRDIWRNRAAPDITVIKGSMHDNPYLRPEDREYVLAQSGDGAERQAREFGDFVDIGGLVLPDFERWVAKEPFTPEQAKAWDVIVGIDPGMRNAAFVWIGLDNENRAFVFHEELLQQRTVPDYVTTIKAANERWGVEDPVYVIDPSARNRAQVNAENVEGELGRFGIYTVHGQNAVEAGVQQMRTRGQHEMLVISPDCLGLRDEADTYAAEDRADGRFVPIRENNHRLDALRYGLMHRPWSPLVLREQAAPLGSGYRQGYAPPYRPEADQAPYGPMGPLS